MNNKSVLKRSVPNLLLLVFISIVYMFIPLPSHFLLLALPAVLIVTVFSVIRKKNKSFKKIFLQLLTSYFILTLIFWLFKVSKALGVVAGLVMIVLLAGYRIYIDTRTEESLYLDSLRTIETRIWGAPLDPRKRKVKK